MRQTKVILSHILARAHVFGEEKSQEEQRREKSKKGEKKRKKKEKKKKEIKRYVFIMESNVF